MNAIDKAAGYPYVHARAELAETSIALARRVHVLCSMNMQMSPAVVPAAYQFPMHVPILDGHVIDRFGDIWGGFVLKRLMDVNGDLMTVGELLIDHLKEGAWARNAWQEHLAHLVNDEFVAMLVSATVDFRPDTYCNHLARLAEEFRRAAEVASPFYEATWRSSFPASRPGLKHSRGMRRPRNPLAPSCLLPPA